MEFQSNYQVSIVTNSKCYDVNLVPASGGDKALVTIDSQPYRVSGGEINCSWVQKQFHSLHQSTFKTLDEFKAALMTSSSAGIEDIRTVAAQQLTLS